MTGPESPHSSQERLEMGMMVSLDQNLEAAQHAVDAITNRFDKSGIQSTIVHRSSGKKLAYVRIHCPPTHWPALAKWLRFDLLANHCSMITGTHFPEGPDDRGWEVVAHLMRMPAANPAPGTTIEFEASALSGKEIPLEFEVCIALPKNDRPVCPSVQSIWVGADWNEKETWDLVGIEFEGHQAMMRVLNPHDTPSGFHPLQKQHKIRYHDFNEMYDDAQGFLRKPDDVGRVK